MKTGLLQAKCGYNHIVNTKNELETALKDAMRSHDEVRKRAVRLALASIRQAEIDRGVTLDEAGVQAILQKEVKSRQEVIEESKTAGRPDLEAQARADLEILKPFMPQQLSAEELEQAAQEAINEVGATSPSRMGQVMKVLLPRLQGRAEGSQVSQIVRKLLT